MAKRLFKVLGLRCGTSLERTVAIKTAICTDYMQVGIKILKIVLVWRTKMENNWILPKQRVNFLKSFHQNNSGKLLELFSNYGKCRSLMTQSN